MSSPQIRDSLGLKPIKSLEANIHQNRQKDASSLSCGVDLLKKRWHRYAMEANFAAIQSLLEEDPNLATRQDTILGFTALHWAAKKGRQDIVFLLSRTAVDVNIRSRGGYTALHLAAIQGHENVIESLVDIFDADINIRDYSGKKAKHYLKKGSSPWIQRKLHGSSTQPKVLVTEGQCEHNKPYKNISSPLLLQMKTLSSSLGTGINLLDCNDLVNSPSCKVARSTSFRQMINSFTAKGKKKTPVQTLNIPDENGNTYRRSGRANSAPDIKNITNWSPRILEVPR